ncbi:MAG TPA: transporter [Rhodanobacteraceae bacterium]|nr:transporter [Rhodanobacteraceae bacterium]
MLTAPIAATAVADNPGYDRPGIGFAPAVLGAGELIWEQGMPDWSRSGDESLYAADTLLRIGAGGPFELQLGTSWNQLHHAGDTVRGRGGSSLGLKFALPATEKFSWGLLGNVGFTDGADAFANAHRQYQLGAAFNWVVNTRSALGAYLETTRSGNHEAHLLALNAGSSLSDAWAGYAEVVLQRAATGDTGSMAGAGLTWQVSPRVQLDASFRRRLGGVTDHWQAGLGVAVFFGHQ